VPLLRAFLLSCFAVLFLFACGAAAPPTGASRLPVYRAEDAALLDDSLSGHLFETAFVPGVPGDDPHFEDRVRAAQSIWVVKVATVSREGSVGSNRKYGVVFRPLETLVGPPPETLVSITVSAKDPSFHWLDRMSGGWVGTEVVLMVRNFQAGDASVLHFHGEPNSPALRARVAAIRAVAQASERAAQAPKK